MLWRAELELRDASATTCQAIPKGGSTRSKPLVGADRMKHALAGIVVFVVTAALVESCGGFGRERRRLAQPRRGEPGRDDRDGFERGFHQQGCNR
jgi:hypothetical protein